MFQFKELFCFVNLYTNKREYHKGRNWNKKFLKNCFFGHFLFLVWFPIWLSKWGKRWGRVGVGLTYRGLSISAFLKHCPREYHIWKVAAQQSMAGYFGMQKQPIRKAECTESMLTKKETERKKQSDMKPKIGAKNFKILWKKVFCGQYSVHNADNNVNFVLFHMKKLSCSYW